jgi:DNA-binding LacI/PurR family transcriptional regulator
VVLLDRDFVTLPQRSKFDLVGIDNFSAGRRVTEHLLQHGCRRLRFVTLPGSTDTTTIVLRIAGMQDALLRYGLPATSDKVVACGDPDHETFVSRLWPRAATRRPDAIICSNDLTAARLLRTLSRMGVSVPEDLRVASFDDVKYAELLNPPLTTIRQPYQALGRIAVATMLERIQKPDLPPRTILLNATLMIRESCGAHLKT